MVHTHYNYKTSHFRSCEKSTWAIDRLNLDSDEKSTLAGSEFHTLTIRSVLVQAFNAFQPSEHAV